MLSVNSLPTNTRELLNRHSDRFRRRETGNNLSLFYFAFFHGKAYDEIEIYDICLITSFANQNEGISVFIG